MQKTDDTVRLDRQRDVSSSAMPTHDDDVAVPRRHLRRPPAVTARRLAHRCGRVLRSDDVRHLASVVRAQSGANKPPALADIRQADEIVRPVLRHTFASPGYSSGLKVIVGIDTFTGSPKLAVSVAVVALYVTWVNVIDIGGWMSGSERSSDT